MFHGKLGNKYIYYVCHHYILNMNIMTKDRKVYMCTQSSNYSPNSIPSLLDRKSIASFILYPYRSLITGARCVRFFFYYIMQGEQLTCLHFLSGRVKLIVTSERLNIHKKMLPPIESQVIFSFQRNTNC